MSRESILNEVSAERERQDGMFGGMEHDATHSATDWISIIIRHLGLAVDDGSPAGICLMDDHCAGADPVRYRRQMVRVAAVAVAALEVFDFKMSQSQPPDWWRECAARMARETGETVYVLDHDNPTRDCRSRGMFAVYESSATEWEKNNCLFKVSPGEKS